MVELNQASVQPQESDSVRQSWTVPNDSPSKDKALSDMVASFQAQLLNERKVEQEKRLKKLEQTSQRALVFRQEVEAEVEEICDKIDLLKKKFADEISKDGSERILSQSLEEYFKPLNADKAMFLAGIDNDITRLDQNLA